MNILKFMIFATILNILRAYLYQIPFFYRIYCKLSFNKIQLLKCYLFNTKIFFVANLINKKFNYYLDTKSILTIGFMILI